MCFRLVFRAILFYVLLLYIFLFFYHMFINSILYYHLNKQFINKSFKMEKLIKKVQETSQDFAEIARKARVTYCLLKESNIKDFYRSRTVLKLRLQITEWIFSSQRSRQGFLLILQLSNLF